MASVAAGQPLQMPISDLAVENLRAVENGSEVSRRRQGRDRGHHLVGWPRFMAVSSSIRVLSSQVCRRARRESTSRCDDALIQGTEHSSGIRPVLYLS